MRTYTNTSAVDDSSPKVPADIRKSHPDDVVLVIEEGMCQCGCEAKARSNFLPGHDARFKGILQRAHQRGNQIAILDGTGTVTSDPAALAADRGWSKYIESAEKQKAKRESAQTASAARKANGSKSGKKAKAAKRIQDIDALREAGKIVKASPLKRFGPLGFQVTAENADHIVTMGGVPANVTVRGKTYTGKVVDVNTDEKLVYVEYKPARGKPKTAPVKLDELELLV